MQPLQPLLEVRGLTVAYGNQPPSAQDVSFSVAPGKLTAIVGESGSGKTTSVMATLGLLGGSARVLDGAVYFQGKDITQLSPRQWRQLRGAKIGLVPQDPNNSLNPLKPVGASIEEAMAVHGIGTAASRRARALELMEAVGIDDPQRRHGQYPHELSGGMKQRVLIAAAIAPEPQVLIADEPTSALDVTVQEKVLDVLDEMRERLNLGIVLITHDLAVAGDRADDVVIMQRGVVVEEGSAAEVLADPQEEYSQRLLADAPSLAVANAYHRPAPDGDVLVRVDHLRQEYGDFVAVNDVSFEVARGSTHAIVGESGSGKTTTGRAISLFRDPTSGSVTIGGNVVTGVDDATRRRLRSTVQLVHQNPFSSLNPKMTVEAIVAEPVRNLTGASKREARAKAHEVLARVALDPQQFARRTPSQLSGGQRQRVAIARALVVEPELVVFDEAVSALDVTVQAQILRLLEDLQQELGLTYIFISHDLAVVRQVSDTVSVLSRGTQVEYGPTDDVFQWPRHEVTKNLIHAIPGARFRARQLGEFSV